MVLAAKPSLAALGGVTVESTDLSVKAGSGGNSAFGQAGNGGNAGVSIGSNWVVDYSTSLAERGERHGRQRRLEQPRVGLGRRGRLFWA